MQKRIIQLVLSEQTLLLFLFLILTLSCLSAPTQFSDKTMVVISTNGLNFRAEASTTSESIGKIPFGEEVEVLEVDFDTRLTLNLTKTVYYQNGNKSEIPISGHWVKSKYKGQIGYLFDTFLCYPMRNEEKLQVNENFVLLYEGTHCFNNFHTKKDWHWYGAFEKNGKLEYKEIEVSYFMIRDPNWGYSDMAIATNLNIATNFIIGSKKPIPTNEAFDYLKNTPTLNCDINVNPQECWKYLERYFGFKITNINSPNKKKQIQVRNNLGKLQILEHPNQYFESFSFNCFKADIDFDGVSDYIIHYGEKSVKTVLYLSSQATKDQIVAPAAIYYNGYCC